MKTPQGIIDKVREKSRLLSKPRIISYTPPFLPITINYTVKWEEDMMLGVSWRNEDVAQTPGAGKELQEFTSKLIKFTKKYEIGNLFLSELEKSFQYKSFQKELDQFDEELGTYSKQYEDFADISLEMDD